MRGVVGTLLALVLGAGSAVLGSSPVSGQAVDTSPPAVAGPAPALVATVASDPLDPPQIQVDGLWITADAADPVSGVVPVNVVFATGFEVPREPWRVSVSVGDPSGGRVRASLVSVGSAGVSGRIEEGDGVQWDDLGPTEVSAAGDGLVTIGVPIGDEGGDAVLWVEAEASVDGEIDVSRTPTFPVVDLLGERPGPSLGTSPFAVVADDPDAAPVLVVAPGPTVQIVGRALEVTTSAAAPADVDGVEVVDVIDTVTITEVGSEPRTSRLEIDRRTGEVRLATAGAEAFVAVPGTTPWLANPPSPTAPGAPMTVTFDLEGLNEAVGGPAFDRVTTRVGVSRILALDDRRILDAAGIGGTMAWFDESLTTPVAVTAPTAATEGISLLALVLAGVVALVVIAAVVALLVRRRRAAEPRPIDRLDPAPAPVAAGVPSLVVPVVPVVPVAASPVASGYRPAPAPAPAPEPAPGPDPAPAAPASAPAADAPDPLAAFLAEVDELSARVDRLGDPVGPASASTTPAGEGGERPR